MSAHHPTRLLVKSAKLLVQSARPEFCPWSGQDWGVFLSDIVRIIAAEIGEAIATEIGGTIEGERECVEAEIRRGFNSNLTFLPERRR